MIRISTAFQPSGSLTGTLILLLKSSFPLCYRMKPKVKAPAMISILFSAFLVSMSLITGKWEKVLIEYFFQPGCPECEMVNTFILPQLKEQFPGKYQIENYDINQAENIPKLVEYQEKFNITKDEPVAMAYSLDNSSAY